MAQYNIQDPQGTNRVIEGPDGASDAEIISQAQKLFGHSGGMPTQDPISAFKAALANHPARPNPIQGFDQDVNQAPGSTDPTGQRLLENAQTAANGYALPALGGSIINGIQKGAGWIGSMMNAGKEASAAAPMSMLEEGLAAKGALTSEMSANKATANKLYEAIPKDVKVPTPSVHDEAAKIVAEIQELPKANQSKDILAMAKEYQTLSPTSGSRMDILQKIRTDLGAKVFNSDGLDKVYAARLSKALASDIENFGKTTLVNGMPPALSQQPTLEANQLRGMWANRAIEESGGVRNISQGNADQVLKYTRPDNFASATPPITNSDVPANLNKANSYYKDMMSLQNHPTAQALSKSRPEEMAAHVFNRGNVSEVNVAKAVLGQTGYGSIQRQFFDQLMHKKDIGQTLSKYSPEFLDAALGSKLLTLLKHLDQQKQLVHAGAIALGSAAGATALGSAVHFGRKLVGGE